MYYIKELSIHLHGEDDYEPCASNFVYKEMITTG